MQILNAEKGGNPMSKHGDFFGAQDMDLSHRAKFQLIINFFSWQSHF